MAFIKQPSASQESESPTTFTSPQDLLDFAKSKTIQTNPLDIVALLEKLGIDVRYEPLENGISGMLIKNVTTNKWIIYVNSLHHPHRQRFTLAHELAHYCRHTPIVEEFVDKIFLGGQNSPAWKLKQTALQQNY